MVQTRIGRILNSSLLYESCAAYVKGPPFLNAVVEVEVPSSTDLVELLKDLLDIETALNRTRTQRWGPRSLDLDIVCVVGANGVPVVVNKSPILIVPHPLAYERRFVLKPLSDINNQIQLKPGGPTVEQLLKQLNDAFGDRLIVDGRTLPLVEIYAYFKETRLTDLKSSAHIIGIVNITPDSFADSDHLVTLNPESPDGEVVDSKEAAERIINTFEQGAWCCDLGAESTRPGAETIPAERQIARLLPVLEAFKLHPRFKEGEMPLFIDTRLSEVMEACATVLPSVGVNDVSGLTYDPEMAPWVAKALCPVIISHSRGTSKTMSSMRAYSDVASDVGEELAQRLKAALRCGILRWRIIADPGFGFAKKGGQNLALIANWDRMVTHLPKGVPILAGWSRKPFLDLIDDLDDDRDRKGAILIRRTFGRLRRLTFYRMHNVRIFVEARSNV